MDTKTKTGSMVTLPSGDMDVAAVTVDLDQVLEAILTWEKPKMAKWVADGLPRLEEFVKRVKGAVVTEMMKEGIELIPTGDGRDLVLKKGDRPVVNKMVLEQAQEAFIEEGYKDDDVLNLVREETVPVTKIATVPQIKKLAKRGGKGGALALMAIERVEGTPHLKIQGTKKLSPEELKRLMPDGDFGGEK